MSGVSDENIFWVDCEMTGLDLDRDCLLEVAALVTDAQLNVISEGPTLVIHQEGTEFRNPVIFKIMIFCYLHMQVG